METLAMKTHSTGEASVVGNAVEPRTCTPTNPTILLPAMLAAGVHDPVVEVRAVNVNTVHKQVVVQGQIEFELVQTRCSCRPDRLGQTGGAPVIQ